MEQQTFIEPLTRKSADITGDCRWTLRRWWHEENHVCWIMLNPSTADAEKDDPTLRRIMHWTEQWGYGGLVVVNLYPFRTSSPAECRRRADWESGPDWGVRDEIHFQNLPTLINEATRASMVMAAWGAGPWDLPYVDHVITTLGEEGVEELYCLGTTSKGDPKHPMARGKHRVPDDAEPVLWKKL